MFTSSPGPDRRRFRSAFFKRAPNIVAPQLLGALLSTCKNGKLTAGMIVEVEAYGSNDPACHAFSGPSERNQVMFWDGGFCYVYFIYGVHHCVNVVTDKAGVGSAVLIRALEPVSGVDLMRKRRKGVQDRLLTNGPGKLCQALGIDATFGGENLMESERIWLMPYRGFGREKVSQSPRIGISKAKTLPWRFFLTENRWVSQNHNRRP